MKRQFAAGMVVGNMINRVIIPTHVTIIRLAGYSCANCGYFGCQGNPLHLQLERQQQFLCPSCLLGMTNSHIESQITPVTGATSAAGFAGSVVFEPERPVGATFSSPAAELLPARRRADTRHRLLHATVTVVTETLRRISCEHATHGPNVGGRKNSVNSYAAHQPRFAHSGDKKPKSNTPQNPQRSPAKAKHTSAHPEKPMKTKNILTTAILAAAGLALSATSAQAAVLSYSTGDLLLGVRQGSATNNVPLGGINNVDFVLNIGSYTQYTAAGSFTLTLGNIGSDLTAIWGSSWNTRSDLFWSVLGTENTTKTNTIYSTAPESPYGTSPGSPAPIQSNSTVSPVVGKFNAAGTAYAINGDSGTGSGGAATNGAGLRQLATDANSWASYNGDQQAFSGNAWSYFTPATEGNFGSGTATSALDLYQIIRSGVPSAAPSGGAITDLGYFAINNAGGVTFNSDSPATPVPEPTGIAVGVLAGLSGLVARRRQRATVA